MSSISYVGKLMKRKDEEPEGGGSVGKKTCVNECK